MTTRYEKGRRAEYKTIRALEALGYTCTRSASSKGLWDVVAVNSTETRLVQVASGKRGKSPGELEPFALLRTAPATVKEVWTWLVRAREPIVKRL